MHFWYILPDEVKSTTLLNRYLEILSPCEKENIFRMRGEQLRKGALLARALVRTTLARCKFYYSGVVVHTIQMTSIHAQTHSPIQFSQ